jgi:hypothetical protein
MAEATITLDVPYWFKQRQAKAEEIAPGTYRVTGPNLQEAVIGVRITDDLHWQAYLRDKADGPEIAVSLPIYPTAREALLPAFELYRTKYIN